MTQELKQKDEKINELSELLEKKEKELIITVNELEDLKKKNDCTNEVFQNLQNQFSKIKDALNVTNKTQAIHQKEKNEIAEKLMESIKLIMEEKSARQTLEALAIEKEKAFHEKVEQIKV